MAWTMRPSHLGVVRRRCARGVRARRLSVLSTPVSDVETPARRAAFTWAVISGSSSNRSEGVVAHVDHAGGALEDGLASAAQKLLGSPRLSAM